MDKIYEKFVQRLFEKYYENGNEEKVNRQPPKKAWKGTTEFSDKNMYPDIVIQKDDVVKKIIDAKHKPDIDIGDLYQLGFYMHEYDEFKQINEIFAILPRYIDHKKDLHEKKGSYEAAITGKKVHVKRLDVNDCVKAIKDGDEGKLRDIVKKLTD